MSRNSLHYETIEDNRHPGDYRVEAIGNDGEVYTAIFVGPEAKDRAQEYASLKNADQLASLSLTR